MRRENTVFTRVLFLILLIISLMSNTSFSHNHGDMVAKTKRSENIIASNLKKPNLKFISSLACTPAVSGSLISASATGNNLAYTTVYVLTDAQGSIINSNATGSFTAPVVNTVTEYRIYAVNYDPNGSSTPSFTVGTLIGNIGGSCAATSLPKCFEVSPSGCTTTSNVALGAPLTASISGNNTSAGYTTQYVLTDANDVILQGPSSTASFTPISFGSYKIYAINYNGTINNLTVGKNVVSDLSGLCFAISAPKCFLVTVDTDGDGVADINDLDDDNDGILDSLEDAAQCTSVSGVVTASTDCDGDGIPNRLDLDSDGDGIKDVIEAGGTDPDNDGKLGTGVPTVDSNGVPTLANGGLTPPNTDGTGGTNPYDLDSDGDGIPDSVEGTVDTDGDGKPNYVDLDSDGDGLPDATEGTVDTDGDGIPNYLDTDSDGDGVLDVTDQCPTVVGIAPTGCPVDTDGDGVADINDLDDDNDGILDSLEDAAQCTSVSGVVTASTDCDGDGIPNRLDLDSDGDGIKDVIEAGGTDPDNDGKLGTGVPTVDSNGVPTLANGGLTPPNTDGTGGTNPYDLDSDGDGIPDSVEGTVDTDGDGKPNYVDLDSDGDGLSDATEGTVDTDGDGIPNYLDTDSDGDGVLDVTDQCPTVVGIAPTGCPVDTDGDGVADINDLDDDNDGILDSLEDAAQCTSVSGVVTASTDCDGDGIPNRLDLDSDGDGIKDVIEAGGTDPDNDGKLGTGVPTVDSNGVPTLANGGLTPPNTDGTGGTNPYDLDSDGDGIPDSVEGTVDTDGDGKPNYVDLDSDGDGLPDATEGTVDTDGDGIPNYLDTDSDGDGVLDVTDQCPTVVGIAPTGCPVDTDGDGVADINDLDDDNDGILDSLEDAAQCTSVSGVVTASTDCDGDGIPNRLDLDSDGDGIKDVIEAGGTDPDNDGKLGTGVPTVDSNGVPTLANGGLTPPNTDGTGGTNPYDLDSDGDGIPDSVEGTVDTDGDGKPNYVDLDSDGDGLSDATEGTVDTDGDGIPNYLDTDSDGDGVLDVTDQCPTVVGIAPTGCPVDTDGDGVADINDLDDDNDGILDSLEDAAQCTSVSGVVTASTDCDGDGIPNRLDLDSDGDGIKDVIEAGGTDPDNDGKLGTGVPTVDSNGVPTLANGGLTPPNTDGTGGTNPYDLDSDGDGIPDSVEGTVDTDGDGKPNYVDLDSDGDGLPDATEGTVDTDGDGIPNYLDTDSDGDGVLDVTDQCPTVVGIAPTGCPVDTDGDGVADINDLDDDNDGILDSLEDAAQCTSVSGVVTASTDCDGDGIPNRLDLDSDGDGIKDVIEAGGTDPDNDGKLGTGVPTVDSNGVPTLANGGLTPPNTDGTGGTNPYDLDSDGDGIPDSVEGTVDTDGDGKPNYVDLDSDGDGLPDATEGTVDTDGDGIPNYLDTDSDGDGVLDVTDQCPTVVGIAPTGCPAVPCAPVAPGTITASQACCVTVGGSSSFTLSGNGAGVVTWYVVPNSATPNSGTGITAGPIVFSNVGTYQIVFRTTNSSIPAGCNVPAVSEATLDYKVKANPVMCTAPSSSNVSVAPSSASIVTGGSASFVLNGGLPYSNVQWVVNPAVGVSQNSGTSSNTGNLVFTQPGVYRVSFIMTNVGDGTCIPVQKVSSALICVGVDPCSPPSAISIASETGNDELSKGQPHTFTATGGISGTMTWTITPATGVSASSGTGNVASVTFSQVGNYVVTFSSINSSLPLGCTQPVSLSESKNITIISTDKPVLAITKSAPSGILTANTNFDYTLQVNNTGTLATTGTITVKDTLQSGLSFVSSSNVSGWTCTGSGQIVTCTRTSSIPSGSNSSFSLTVTALSNGVYQNKAGVYGGGDPVAINGTTAAQSNNTSVSVGQSVVKLTAKVFLRGAYDTNVGLMLDGLRSQGLIPLVQPYGKGSYTDIPHVGAEEATTTSVLSVTGNNAIVDWVSVELRDKTNPSTILYSRSGLVQRDGDIVDVDGVSCLSFVGAVPESYYVTIRHRNHLGAMTANAIALTSSCSALVDFTSPSLSLYKKATTDPEYTAYPTVDLGSVRALWGGNASPDRFVIYQGPNNDRTFIGSVVLTDAGNTEGLNNYMVTGYLRPDINLDGLVIFQGPGNDVNLLFNEIFTHPENVEKLNNFIIYQQLP